MALPRSTLIRRGLCRRCPVCGSGGLFQAWVHMAPRCPGCGLRLPREAGQWLGSWFLNICVAQAVLVGSLAGLVAMSWPDRPPTGALLLVMSSAIIVPVAFFPWSRTIWVAIDLCMRPLGLDDGVAPGTELEQLRGRRPRHQPSARWGSAPTPTRRVGRDQRRPRPSTGASSAGAKAHDEPPSG